MKLVLPGPRHINVTFSTKNKSLDEFEAFMILIFFLQDFCPYVWCVFSKMISDQQNILKAPTGLFQVQKINSDNI